MCACIQITPGNVLCHHSKHLMGYFEFLHGSRIICLCMSISEKLHWQYVSKKLEEAETHCLHLFEYDTIPMHPEEQHLPFKQTGTTIVFSSGYQSCNWPPSGPFCWQNLCSSCNSGTNLVVILEYTFFQLRSNTKKSCISFLLDVRCSKRPRFFFLQLFAPNDNVFALLGTLVAQMLLTPRWVSRRKDVK